MSKHDSSRYYWIKIKTNFLTSKRVDFLMRQKDGANYVVLYQSLCLLAVNSDGVLADKIGEYIIPFDPVKIQGETKNWFSIDTIRVGLEMFQKLGLIYKMEDGVLKLTNFDDIVGSETYAAERMRLAKAGQVAKIGRNPGEKFSQENRDKSIDSRYLDTRDKEEILDTPIVVSEEETISEGGEKHGRTNPDLPF